MDKKLTATHRFLILIAVIAGLWFLGRELHLDLAQIRTWLAQYPLWLSGTFFILIYVALTTFTWFGPIDVLRIGGALLFGAYWSALFIYLAEIVCASVLFLLSRKLGREFIEEKFHLKDKARKFSPDDASFWTALILRINPFVWFRFIDVGFGLTKLSFIKYLWVVVLGSPLRILGVQFLIAAIGEAIFTNPQLMVSYLRENRFIWSLMALYMLAVVVMTVAVFTMTFFKQRALQRQLLNLKQSPPSSPRTP